MSTKKRRKTSSKRKGSGYRSAAAGWAGAAGVGTVMFMLGYGVGWMIWATASGLLSVGMAIAHKRGGGKLFEGRVVATTKQDPTPRQPKAWKSASQRKRERRSAVLAGKIRSGWTKTGTGTRGCNSKCQNSRAPSNWCRCPCGGVNHGRARGWGTRVAAATQRKPSQTPARPRRKPTAKERAREPRSSARAIRYRAKDGREYTATATPTQIAQLRRQGRYLGQAQR